MIIQYSEELRINVQLRRVALKLFQQSLAFLRAFSNERRVCRASVLNRILRGAFVARIDAVHKQEKAFIFLVLLQEAPELLQSDTNVRTWPQRIVRS
jgi:hypothetical protein